MLTVAVMAAPARSQSTPAQNRYGLEAVACVAANSCFGVGHAALSDGEQPPLIARWDGTQWTVFASPTPTARLLGISCVSGACMAVGRHTTSGGYRTLTERWTGSAWSIVPSPNLTNASSNQLVGVACSTANQCIAVGGATVQGVEEPLVERWNGSRWTIDAIARPSSTDSALHAIACASARSCVAVGAKASPNTRALVEHWNGTQWSMQTVVNPAGSTHTFLDGVTCTGVANCTAVGYTGSNANGVHTLVEHWNGSAWTRQSGPDYPCCNPSSGRLHSVACPTSAACMAVGDAFAFALTVRRSAGTWLYQSSPQPNNVQLGGVSCPTATNCVAVGTNFASGHTRAEHWDGTRWTIQPSP
jgi:hypothetical protein